MMSKTYDIRPRRPAGLATLLSLALYLAIGASPAAAGETEVIGNYTFTEIGRQQDLSESIFHVFEGAPVVAGDGTLLFAGSRRVDGVWRRGIFAGDGTTVTTIIDDTTGMSQFKQLSVNEAGAIAFQARDVDLVRGIFKIESGVLTRVADTSGDFHSVVAPDINIAGEVAFRATFDVFGNQTSIYKGDGVSGPTLIAEQGGPFADFFGEPSINDDGQVAFFARRTDGGDSVYVGDGSTPVLLYEETGPLTQVSTPDLNNDGTVFFVGSQSGLQGVYAGDGGPLAAIADRNDGFFTFFSGPSINNNGGVAFLTDRGIYTGPDLVADNILGDARELFGFPIRGFGLGRGLNDRGDIAMLIRLKTPDKSSLHEFVVLARFIPEPSGVALALAAVGILSVRSRRSVRRR